jgi:hypothetical protein
MEIRYVGKTTNPKTRLYNHIKLVNKGKTHCKSWIKSLLEDGLSPLLNIIDTCQDSGAIKEQQWISFYKKGGCKLCNHTIGSECGILSEDHISKKEAQVLKALESIARGIGVLEAEKLAGLSPAYLYKVRKGEIAFLQHIKVPYFRKMKRNNSIDKG